MKRIDGSKVMDDFIEVIKSIQMVQGTASTLVLQGAILDLAARLDKLTERVDGIEKAHKPIEYCTCDPEKRSIRQGLFAWDMRCSVCGKPINPAELYATNDAKPAPDEEPAFICSGCNDPMEYEGQVHEYWDDGKPYQCGKAVKNLGKPAPDREMVEPPEFHDFCERIFIPGTDYRTGDIRMLLREHIDELREIVARWDAGV